MSIFFVKCVLLQVAEIVKFPFQVNQHVFQCHPRFPDDLHPFADFVTAQQDRSCQVHFVGPMSTSSIECCPHFIQVLCPRNQRINRWVTASIRPCSRQPVECPDNGQ